MKLYIVFQKVVHFYICDKFSKCGPISYLFTIKFRKDPQRKLGLKLPPPLKYLLLSLVKCR